MKKADGALFNTAAVVTVDARLVDKLKAQARSAPSRRFRLCLHASTADQTQEMIVVHCRDNYSRPHAHRSPLTYMIIEGRMRVLLFDDAGKVTQRIDLAAFSSGNAFALHIEPERWYMPVCLTEQVVFYETKWGPFRRETTNSWAPWSPAEHDAAAIAAYRRSLGVDFDET